MFRREILKGVAGLALASFAGMAPAFAQQTVKVGIILPMTGPFASTGRQIEAAAKLYQAQHGDTVAGKKVQIIIRDDTGAPDVTKRRLYYETMEAVLAKSNKVIVEPRGVAPYIPLPALTGKSGGAPAPAPTPAPQQGGGQ